MTNTYFTVSGKVYAILDKKTIGSGIFYQDVLLETASENLPFSNPLEVSFFNEKAELVENIKVGDWVKIYGEITSVGCPGEMRIFLSAKGVK